MNNLGKGIIFPIELQNGAPIIRQYPELIKSSIEMILSWPIGDKFFQANFGSKLEELLEEPNDFVLNDLIELYIFQAITTWETRVEEVNTEILKNPVKPETAEVRIRYRIKQTQTVDSFIYPFYKNRLI